MKVEHQSAWKIAHRAAAPPRLLAIASGGGHWVELLRLRPAFDGYDTAFVSMFDNYLASIAGHRFYTVPDASRFALFDFLPIVWCALTILVRERPRAIVTTGSAPMLPFLVFGRLLGIRTLWIDSIANPKEMSTSGRIAKRIAHVCISQWEDVAQKERIPFWGRIV